MGEKEPGLSRPVDVPIMAAAAAAPAAPAAAVKENTPTQLKFETAPDVRPRRESRRNPTAEPKPSPLPHPPL